MPIDTIFVTFAAAKAKFYNQNDTMQTRKLTADEVSALESNGCRCAHWDSIAVRPGFDARALHGVVFAGRVTVGATTGTVTLDDGLQVPAGISNAMVADCEIGDNCLIRNVGGLLRGYTIGSGVVISGCGSICARPDARCGQGTRVAVLNEGGGREVTIFSELNSAIAAMMAFYRYRPGLIARLEGMIADHVASKPRGAFIGDGARIENCTSITDVSIGAAAVVSGASRLADGTVLSCAEMPATVGAGVIAEHFVMAEGCEVTDGAIVRNAYVGQCTQVGNGFFAENMVASANCQFFNGEAVSVLAGPFAVTHHKTTLLIAQACSFFNAGSATNASNHHYRLGPLHQAVMERGVKTGSGSYVLEPAHIGAFSMVVGHHRSHPDTSRFPFSLLAERDGASILVPAQNLKSIGLFRDGRKWLQRDRRPARLRTDAVDARIFSPLTVGRMIDAADELERLASGSKGDVVMHGGVRMQKLMMTRAVRTYRQTALAWLMRTVALAGSAGTFADDDTRWVDLGGMIVPRSMVARLTGQIESGQIAGIPALLEALERMRAEARECESAWAALMLGRHYGIDPADRAAMHAAATQWLAVAEDLRSSLAADAAKDFGGRLTVGYGHDSDTDADADFAAVRGQLDDNASVADCLAFCDEIIRSAKDFIISLAK